MSSEFIARTFEQSNTSSPARFVWSHVRRHPLTGLGMIVGAFSNAALASAMPALAGAAFNAIKDNQDLKKAGMIALAIVGTQVVRGVLQWVRNFSAEVFAQRIERDVRDELYASLLGKSMNYHDRQPVGEIMARVTNDVREMNMMMSPGFNLVVGSTMFLVMPVFVAPTIYPSLILVPGLFLLFYIFIQYRFLQNVHRVAQKVRKSFGQMNARLAETLDGIEVVKGSAQEYQESENFNELVDQVRDWFIEQGRIEARYFAALLLSIATVAGFLHAIILYRAGAINTGDIVSYMGQLSLLGFPVFSSVFSLSRIASGYAGAKRILAVINAKTDLDQNLNGHSSAITGNVEFDHVIFSYEPGKEVLHDITFRIEPGQTVALVGQTGSGKTTITKLINRMYDVDSGHVLIDGVDVREWDLASLRSQISIIEQEIFLFSRSIAENISYGVDDASPEQIEEAARKAQAHDFIMDFPEGYDTVIGQRGVTLSGGQRQRLAIARAFLTHPQILILDDSTSAIDSATEDHIQKAIWAAAKGRTTIIITHRLSQIRWADHIIVMRRGTVAEQGAHDDLLKTSEAYQRIFARYEGPSARQEDLAEQVPTSGQPQPLDTSAPD